MRKIFQSKYLTMACFLALLTVMCILGIIPVFNAAREAGWVLLNKGTLDISIIEDGYSDNFVGKNHFFAINSYVHKLIGSRELNNIYRQDNGRLTYVIEEYDMEGIAANTVAFRDALQAKGIPMTYVNTPFQIHQTDKQLPIGVEDYSNENADRFLEYLQKNQVSYLDLRDCIADEGLNHYDLYFKTDHHWTPEAGLWASERITDFLAQLDRKFAVDKELFAPSNYNFEVYEDVFLGSAGRRVGSFYAGLDDFTLITPNFKTNFSFSVPNKELHRKGKFSEALLDIEMLTSKNILDSNSYAVYCGGSFDQIEIQNYGTGPESTCNPQKILVIRDSYSDVLIPFLSLAYAEARIVDLRIFESDLMNYIEDYDPDMVLVVYNPGAYELNNLNMFDFLPEDPL